MLNIGACIPARLPHQPSSFLCIANKHISSTSLPLIANTSCRGLCPCFIYIPQTHHQTPFTLAIFAHQHRTLFTSWILYAGACTPASYNHQNLSLPLFRILLASLINTNFFAKWTNTFALWMINAGSCTPCILYSLNPHLSLNTTSLLLAVLLIKPQIPSFVPCCLQIMNAKCRGLRPPPFNLPLALLGNLQHCSHILQILYTGWMLYPYILYSPNPLFVSLMNPWCRKCCPSFL